MKLFITLILAVVYVSIVLSYPHRGTVQTREKSKSSSATTVIGNKPANFDSPEFARLLFSCVDEEVWSMLKSCEEDTTLKLNTSKPATIMGPLGEHSKDLLQNSGSDELDSSEEDESDRVVCGCVLKKSGTVDEVTGQFDMDSYASNFENTALSSEQKSSTIASFKSCMTANLIAPTLPIFINWAGDDKTKADANGNFVSAIYTLRCDATSLIQNGCPDASVTNSTLAWILNEIQIGLTKKNHH